jgi:hypothetical protein
MSSGTLYCVALVRADVSQKISPPSLLFFTVLGFQSCCRGITVDQPLHKGLLCMMRGKKR